MKYLLLENPRVRISEITYDPGVPRHSYLRPTDQIVVFLDPCEFDRVDAQTGELLRRRRSRGETLWHPRGELAPVLINRGPERFRTLLIELLPE
jgi:hypothetical protein